MAEKKAPVKVLVAIVRRDKIDTAVDIMNTMGASAAWSMMGHGVGRTDIMNLLGLHSSECGVVLGIIAEEKAHKTLGALCRNLEFYKHNRGFALTLNLSAITRNTLSAFKQWGKQAEEQQEQYKPAEEDLAKQDIKPEICGMTEKQMVFEEVLKDADERNKEAEK